MAPDFNGRDQQDECQARQQDVIGHNAKQHAANTGGHRWHCWMARHRAAEAPSPKDNTADAWPSSDGHLVRGKACVREAEGVYEGTRRQAETGA